jgi:hypothetical protein
VEKAAIWIFAGFLAYICFVLTSISGKLDELSTSNLQYAVLSDTGREKPSVAMAEQIVMSHEARSFVTPSNVGLALLSMVSIFVSWHLSRLYHTHEWTKAVLRKNFTLYAEPYRIPAPPETLHADQDCVGEPAVPDGRIKDSWLPLYITRLDTGWKEPQSETGRDIELMHSHSVRM